MIREDIESQLKNLFNQLEARYATGASLEITKGNICGFYDEINSKIGISFDQEGIECLGWVLAHEFGHALEYKNKKETMTKISRREQERSLIICICGFITTALVIYFAFRLKIPGIGLLTIYPIFILMIKSTNSKQYIQSRQNSEILADRFANEVVGGGEHYFTLDKIKNNPGVQLGILRPIFHPSAEKRRIECLKYPLKHAIQLNEDIDLIMM